MSYELKTATGVTKKVSKLYQKTAVNTIKEVKQMYIKDAVNSIKSVFSGEFVLFDNGVGADNFTFWKGAVSFSEVRDNYIYLSGSSAGYAAGITSKVEIDTSKYTTLNFELEYDIGNYANAAFGFGDGNSYTNVAPNYYGIFDTNNWKYNPSRPSVIRQIFSIPLNSPTKKFVKAMTSGNVTSGTMQIYKIWLV